MLSYQKTLFYKNIPPEYHKERIPGLDIKTLLVILDMQVLHGDLHRTYNMHDALYNSSVVEKAVDMLSFKYLSFQELHEVRVAFQLYEHEDTLGLVIDEHILLRTLKACGRSVSPIRLMQHIKHADTHVQDRLMLYEFMDLLLLCERDSDIHVPTVPQVSGIDPRNNLFRICDFQSILMPQEEKKITQLNSAYEVIHDRLEEEYNQGGDVHNANTKIENLNWDIETQDLQEERSQDHLQVSPRRSIPTRENIYSTLKSRLQATNTLLDYGDIQVPHSPYTRFLAQQVDRKRTQSTENKLMVEKPGTLPGEEDLRSKGHTGGEVVELLEKFQVDRKRTKKNETNLKVENPGTLPGEEDLRSKGHTGGEVVELLEKFQVDRKRTKKPDRNLMVENPGTLPGKEDLRSKGHTDEVVDLLEKFQEANLVASGRKGFVHNDKHEWMHTTFV
ncbi:hypothetical protein QZH41_014245 [Actinostola sp. cb2023]|nr:hypothetical protein QZH41_014245 [Actinostola sp. cb2023]